MGILTGLTQSLFAWDLAEIIACYVEDDKSKLDFWLQMTAVAGVAIWIFAFLHKASVRVVSD